MAHVPLIDRPKGLLRRYAWRYSRKEFGKVVDPVRAAAHHSGVLMASGALETTVAKSWNALDPHLLVLLESLSPPERAAFLLREVFGYDYDDIAAMLDKESAACRQLVARARRHVA